MKDFFKNLFFLGSPSKESPTLREEDLLLEEIEDARKKIDYAWNRLDYAAPEYVEIAVLELLLAETHYGLLNKRYRLMLGTTTENPNLLSSATKLLETTLERNQNHAFYKSLIPPTPESSSSPSATHN